MYNRATLKGSAPSFPSLRRRTELCGKGVSPMSDATNREHDDLKTRRRSDAESELAVSRAGNESAGPSLPAISALAGARLQGRASTPVRAAAVQTMQRTHGNRAVQRFMSAVAESTETEDDEIASRIERKAGSGGEIDPGARAHLEGGIGASLEGVRIHTDAEADTLARNMDAVAFTSGQDIFFRSGAYNPHSSEGMRLLAHEATHTVQQAAGPVAGTPTEGGIALSDPSDEFEQAAERTADAVASSTPGPAPVQRMMMPNVDPSALWDAMPTFDDIGTGISGIGSVLGGQVSTFGHLAAGAVSGAHEFGGDIVGGGMGMLGGGISAGSDFLFGAGSTGSQIGNVVGGGIGQIGDILESGLDRGGARRAGNVEDYFGNIGSGIGNIGSGIGNFVGGLGDIDPSYLLM